LAFEGKKRGAVRVDLEISSKLIMAKDFLGRVIICRHEPGCFLRGFASEVGKKALGKGTNGRVQALSAMALHRETLSFLRRMEFMGATRFELHRA
jgi:hypothetical protein